MPNIKELSNKAFSRRANTIMMDGGMGMMGSPNSAINRVPMMYVDPLLDPVLMMFPRENDTQLNARLRHYYTYNPIVHSVIDLHSSYALSDFELRCEDKDIEQYYNDIKERLDLLTMMINLNRDFWLLGNAYMYGEWDYSNSEWIRFNQFPPENIEIHRSYAGGVAVYFLKPDESTKKVLQSSSAADMAVASTIPAEFRNAILTGSLYQLANERIIHFANRPAQYSLQGESILKSCLKDLMFEDKMRLLQFTYADRAMYPIKHWKVGSEAKGWFPDKKHFDETKALIMAGINDPDYNLITHPFVNLDIKDQHGSWDDLKAQFEFAQKRIMIGLFCNDAMLGGEAGPYAKDMINMKVVMHRYLMNRNLLERLIREKVFLPIAKEHGLIKRTQAEIQHKLRLSSSYNNFILPKFFYKERVNLLSSQSEQEMLLRLRQNKEIPFELVADMFGWDMNQLKEKFNNEADTVFDPLYKAAKDDLSKEKAMRNRILNGEFKNNDFSKVDETKENPQGKAGREMGGSANGGGRPPLPEGELKMEEPAILPNGEGDLSPRGKQEGAGELPAPEGGGDLGDVGDILSGLGV